MSAVIPDDRPSEQTASRGSLWLGLFVVWQIWFLVSMNLLTFVEEAPDVAAPVVEEVAPGWSKRQGHGYVFLQAISRTNAIYADFTGQEQAWSLFAPGIGANSGSLAVKLVFEDADGNQHERLFLNANDVEDIHHYVRFGQNRFRKFESVLTLSLERYDGETEKEANERLRKRILRCCRSYPNRLDAYLRWRLRLIREEHPDLPAPSAAILVVRRYKTNPPGSERRWDGPFPFPIARLRPHAKPDPNCHAVEPWNPKTERFERVRR